MNLSSAGSFTDVLRFRAQNEPERTAFLYLQDGESETTRLTFAGLDRAARAIAAHLSTIDPPVRQALLLYPPGLEFVAAFWGCLYAGVAAVPVHPPRQNQSLARLKSIVADAQATLAMTTSGQLDNLRRHAAQDEGLASLEWLASDSVRDGLAEEWSAPRVTRDSLAFLQYTSGSTGSPKGVMVSHGNLLANSEFLRHCFELSRDSVSVTWLPSFHDMGLVDGVLQPTYTGFLGVMMPPVAFLQTPLKWLKGVTRYRATHCGGPNFGYELCARKITPEQSAELDLSSWLTAYNGAEPVSRDTLERFAARFAPCGFRARYFYPCYGMAESTLIITGGSVAADPVYLAADAGALERRRIEPVVDGPAKSRFLVGCGRPWLDTRVEIVNPETLLRCAPDEIGEIWASGESVAQGYWRRPDLTQEFFQAHLGDTGEGPFLRTGDLGFIRDGELFVAGRIKDVIIIRGHNHYPQDIEQTVQDCYPGFRPACGAAFSVDVNGEEKLVVVQEVERTHMRHLDVSAATRAIREAVANEHGIQVYRAVFIKPASIPKTSSGKIQRHACKRAFLEGTLDVVEPKNAVAS